MTYFKYTSGEAFHLEKEDYTGFFHVDDGVAYTGRIPESDREILTPKNNFISEFYINKEEFDTTYGNITQIDEYYSNVFDILDKNTLDEMFGILNQNNINVFKNLVLHNPNILNKNSVRYYGLSSTSVDSRDNDVLTPKTVYSHMDPFSRSEEWSYLDSIVAGSFIVDDNDNFLYFTVAVDKGDIVQRTLKGSFTSSDLMELVDEISDDVVNFHFDDEGKLLYKIRQTDIEIYDTSNYPTCQNFILVDRIPVNASAIPVYKWNRTLENYEEIPITWDFKFSQKNTDIIPELIRIGKNVRVEMNSDTIFFLNKNSTELYFQYDIRSLGLGDIKDLDIRNVDDLVSIVHFKNNSLYVTFLDPFNVKESIKETEIKSFNNSEKVRITLSTSDSNVFYLYNSNEFQSRFINSPSYPSGRINYEDFLYLDDYLWDTTFERFDKIPIKWDSNRNLSNFYNNLVVSTKVQNDFLYIIIHNVGRIYTIKHSLKDIYISSIPLQLEKFFKGLNCSESSIGLYLNNSLVSLTKDTLNLYSKAKNKFKISANSDPVTAKIESLDLNANNLIIHGNETINVVATQRVLNNISSIQSNLICSRLE
jgi:hypothetical protein